MISLVKYLCTVFKCDADALPDIIRQHPYKVFENIKDLHLYYSPASRKNDELTPVKADGITKAGVCTLFACGGHLGITVEQYYYMRTGRTFRHPKLQCVIQQQGEYGGEIYLPIELIKVDQKR